jgi:mannose-1-phosphate guanylyltransferase/mannose-6-phosphate isomerase
MLVPVILSGGAGARLWPVSREAFPKPFIRLSDGTTLLGRALARACRVSGVSHVVTVTNREYYFLTQDEYCKAGSPHWHVFLLEPVGRNTAPAIAMAALQAVEAHGAGTELLVLPADHLIQDEEGFVADVETARELARTGSLVTFGVPPTHPEPGFGYIECGAPVDSKGSSKVARFVEKPPADQAAGFIATGRFLWNSGMFCFRADAFLEALKACHPVLHAKAQAAWQAANRSKGSRIDLPEHQFAELPDISVDYAVMEKHPDVAVVRAGFDWNDIGSWNALGTLTVADENGNRTQGETLLVDARDCYIQSDSRMVAAVGVQNLVVVDTPDALLVANKDRVQDVKQIVQQLKLTNHSAHLLHRTVHRPWGTYTMLEEGPGYKIKRIVVKAGASLSMQMHHHRSEHWVVINGTARVVNGDQQLVIRPNESTFIPMGHKHRLSNPGKEDVVIIEVQAGAYLGEDDIVRFDDIYGRAEVTPERTV